MFSRNQKEMRLTSFSARCCSKLTSQAFIKLIQNLGRTLENLDVSGCVLIQNEAFCSLRDNKTLKVLLLEHLRISNQGLSFLRETNLKILSLFSKASSFIFRLPASQVLRLRNFFQHARFATTQRGSLRNPRAGSD